MAQDSSDTVPRWPLGPFLGLSWALMGLFWTALFSKNCKNLKFFSNVIANSGFSYLQAFHLSLGLVLAPPWSVLGLSWAVLGLSWCCLGAVLGPSSGVLGCLGPVLGLCWGCLGPVSDLSWSVRGVLGLFWTAALGRTLPKMPLRWPEDGSR